MIKYPRKKRAWGDIPLTVCIAAISKKGAVFCSADRLITGENIQYQPPSSKIWPFTNSVFALVAGNINIQKMVFDSTNEVAKELIKTTPKTWIKVKDIAEIYASKYVEIKNDNIQKRILAPFKLTHKTFVSKQGKMSESFVSKIKEDMESFNFPAINTLIVGCDEDGSHIYSVDDDNVLCHDSIGFAARGAGMEYAEAHLMEHEYSRDTDASHAILYVHRAKKLSEVAPGVGKATDLIGIGPLLGFHIGFPRSCVNLLDKYYEKYRAKIKKSDQENIKIIDPVIKKLADSMVCEAIENIKKSSKDQSARPNNSSTHQT